MPPLWRLALHLFLTTYLIKVSWVPHIGRVWRHVNAPYTSWRLLDGASTMWNHLGGPCVGCTPCGTTMHGHPLATPHHHTPM